MIFPPRIIVYDLDGTLVDAFRDIWLNLNTVFAKHGLKPVAFEQVRSTVGDGVRMLVRRCLGSEELHLFDEIHPEYHQDCKVFFRGEHVMTVGATVPEMHVDIWSGSHPFYTGKASFVDAAGRVEKFQNKFKGDYFKKKK